MFFLKQTFPTHSSGIVVEKNKTVIYIILVLFISWSFWRKSRQSKLDIFEDRGNVSVTRERAAV